MTDSLRVCRDKVAQIVVVLLILGQDTCLLIFFLRCIGRVAPDLQQTLTLLPLICDKKVVSLPLI